jgi:hypothetical protein
MYKCSLEKNGEVVWYGYFHKPANLANIADAFCEEATDWLQQSLHLATTPDAPGWWVGGGYSNGELAKNAKDQSDWFLALAKDVLINCRKYEVYHQEIKVHGDK